MSSEPITARREQACQGLVIAGLIVASGVMLLLEILFKFGGAT